MKALGLEADSSTYSKSHGATESRFFLGLEREPRDLGITPPLQSPDPSHLVEHRALRKYSQDTHWTHEWMLRSLPGKHSVVSQGS